MKITDDILKKVLESECRWEKECKAIYSIDEAKQKNTLLVMAYLDINIYHAKRLYKGRMSKEDAVNTIVDDSIRDVIGISEMKSAGVDFKRDAVDRDAITARVIKKLKLLTIKHVIFYNILVFLAYLSVIMHKTDDVANIVGFCLPYIMVFIFSLAWYDIFYMDGDL